MARRKSSESSIPKALKGVRNQDLYPQNDTQDDYDINNLLGRARVNNYNSMHGHIGYEALNDPSLTQVQEPSDNGPEFGNQSDNSLKDYGQSYYDRNGDGSNILVNPTQEDIQNRRAESEPWYVKISNGIDKGALLAGTTFVDGTAGLLAGIVQGVKNLSDGNDKTGFLDGIWNNGVTRTMQSLNDWSEKAMPNYYSTQEQNSPWYSNIFTANFLGDKFLKNLGFTIGAFYSGGVWTKAIDGIEALAKLGAGARALEDGAQLVNDATKGQRIGAAVKMAVGNTISTVNEATTEALSNSRDWYQTQKATLDDKYRANLVSIAQNYQKGTPEYDDKMQQATDAYQNTLSRMKDDSTKMGNVDFLLNLPILGLSNYVQFGKLYANGFDTARREAEVLGRGGAKDLLNSIENKTAGDFFKSNVGKLGLAKAIVKEPLAEGSEEAEQQWAQTMPGMAYQQDVENYYKAQFDPQHKQKVIDWTKAIADSVKNTLGDGDTWEQFFIGALTGAMGMPMLGRKHNAEDGLFSSMTKSENGLPVDLQGGVFGAVREYNDLKNRSESIAQKLNDRIQDPDFVSYYRGLVRNGKLQDAMDDAAMNNDRKTYKDAEAAKMVSDLTMFDNAGKLDTYKNLIKGITAKYSDDDIQSIINSTQKTVSRFDNDIKAKSDQITAERKNNISARDDLQEYVEKNPSLFTGTTDEYGIPVMNEKVGDTDKSIYSKLVSDVISSSNTLKDLGDELNNLNAQKEATRNTDKTVGPFIDKNGQPMGTDEVRQKLQDNEDNILKSIDMYTESKRQLDANTGYKLSSDTLGALTYLKYRKLDNDARSADIVKGIQKDVLPVIADYYTDEIEKLNSKVKENTKEDARKDIQKNIETLQKNKDVVNKLITSTPEKVVSTFANNPAMINNIINEVNQQSSSTFDSLQKKTHTDNLKDVQSLLNDSTEYTDRLNYFIQNPKKMESDFQKARDSENEKYYKFYSKSVLEPTLQGNNVTAGTIRGIISQFDGVPNAQKAILDSLKESEDNKISTAATSYETMENFSKDFENIAGTGKLEIQKDDEGNETASNINMLSGIRNIISNSQSPTEAIARINNTLDVLKRDYIDKLSNSQNVLDENTRTNYNNDVDMYNSLREAVETYEKAGSTSTDTSDDTRPGTREKRSKPKVPKPVKVQEATGSNAHESKEDRRQRRLTSNILAKNPEKEDGDLINMVASQLKVSRAKATSLVNNAKEDTPKKGFSLNKGAIQKSDIKETPEEKTPVETPEEKTSEKTSEKTPEETLARS
jgi:hypothetical protein